MKNRFMLAPLTNSQSHEDGTLSEEEYHWLTMRAKGGFGLTMTCAAHVQEVGKGFPGQLGAFSDDHLSGLKRLAEGIKRYGSLSNVQLHHAGMRSPSEIIGEAPVSASADEETRARALSTDEVRQLRDDFIAAAIRCDQAGFDGVELHGAHGYILCQFFAEETNRREDEYGGSFENRYRILNEIIEGIRHNCRADFQLGVRLSLDHFGTRDVSFESLDNGFIDSFVLDQSLIADVDENHSHQRIVRAAIAMAQGLDIEVAAEGVETLTQLEFLRSCNCDLAQGFLISRPIQPEKVASLLRSEIAGSRLLARGMP